MIWIPSIDEIPMSVSYIDRRIKGITFKNVGEATEALSKLKKGEKIGIRGPYGNGFKIFGKKILIIAGGTGIAMVPPTVDYIIRKKIKCTVVLGVKTKDELFFDKYLEEIGVELIVTTDDGSKGLKGLASDIVKKILLKEKFDLLITCGPELMMKKLYNLSGNMSFQASLERYIKCGIGICGQCCVGEGLRICKEGPIFDRKTLKNIQDFGLYRRDASGRLIEF
jgi:dihydroorotate dehydrogenase electron transfer subunit